MSDAKRGTKPTGQFRPRDEEEKFARSSLSEGFDAKGSKSSQAVLRSGPFLEHLPIEMRPVASRVFASWMQSGKALEDLEQALKDRRDAEAHKLSAYNALLSAMLRYGMESVVIGDTVLFIHPSEHGVPYLARLQPGSEYKGSRAAGIIVSADEDDYRVPPGSLVKPDLARLQGEELWSKFLAIVVSQAGLSKVTVKGKPALQVGDEVVAWDVTWGFTKDNVPGSQPEERLKAAPIWAILLHTKFLYAVLNGADVEQVLESWEDAGYIWPGDVLFLRKGDYLRVPEKILKFNRIRMSVVDGKRMHVAIIANVEASKALAKVQQPVQEDKPVRLVH